MLNWWEYYEMWDQTEDEMMEDLKSILQEDMFGTQFDHKQWSFLQNDN